MILACDAACFGIFASIILASVRGEERGSALVYNNCSKLVWWAYLIATIYFWYIVARALLLLLYVCFRKRQFHVTVWNWKKLFFLTDAFIVPVLTILCILAVAQSGTCNLAVQSIRYPKTKDPKVEAAL